MAKSKTQTEQPPELRAVSAVYAALKELDPAVQLRALRYAAEMLNISFPAANTGGNSPGNDEESRVGDSTQVDAATVLPPSQTADDAEGINAVALKWIKRSGLEPKSLQKLFSLGIDEIDLVAKSVPGSSKRERMRNVLLLKGVAAYLGSGAARITHDQLKEACLHYNAYDVANYARYLKEFAPDVGGTKEAGFTLTARGLNSATELVKELLVAK